MNIGRCIKEVASSWSAHNISNLSAALAYYTLFSLTPIILICVGLVGFFFSEDVARGEIFQQIKDLIGADTSIQIQRMIVDASSPTDGIMAQIVGAIVLFIGSSAVFTEIQGGLNLIWGVETNPKLRWFTILKQRILSFIMVLGVAFLLLLSLVISVILSAMNTYLSRFWNISVIEIFIAHSVSFLIGFFLFAMIFKILPDVKIQWRDVWIGAIISTGLFSVGKYVVGIYISQTHLSSTFGAAGSLIILLVWVYYSAQIFFIGAEITKVITFQKKKKIIPKPRALIVNKHTVPHASHHTKSS